MSSERSYTKVIDLTSKAQRERRETEVKRTFAEAEAALPEAQLDALPDTIQAVLSAAGWTELMPVQKEAMPYLLDRRDLIVQSRTGSGKTGAFLLPLFTLLDPAQLEAQALILAPTRELARQIFEEFERMKVATPETYELQAALIYGGVKYGPQTRALKGGAQLVIGTPGRILDHLDQRNLSLEALRILILDEADEMLSMGFYPAMQKLKRFLPRERNSYMFSATMPPKVQNLGREFLRDPGFLSLSTGQVGVETIEHRCYLVSQMDKDRALVRLIEWENPDSAIIFVNTKRDVEYLVQFLQNYGHHADEISGDLSQREREAAMDRIRKGELRFLVATDVAARGIDISDLSHVFLYDIPEDPEYYVHRTGRTARAGKAGIAIALATVDERYRLRSIVRRYDIEIDERELPTLEDVAGRMAERVAELLEERFREKNNLERERLERFVPVVRELAAEEPALLAMLIDATYHAQTHVQPFTSEQSEETPEEASDAEDQAEEEQPQRNGRRGRNSRSRRRGRPRNK